MFGVTVDYNGNNLLKDPSYLTYIFQEVRQTYTNNSGTSQSYIREYTSLNTKLWENSFVGMNQTLVKAVGIDQYYCPSDNNFTVAATFYASRYDYIQIKVFRCANSTTSSVICKSTQEIEDVTKASTVRVPIINTYFDFNNYKIKILSKFIWFIFW